MLDPIVGPKQKTCVGWGDTFFRVSFDAVAAYEKRMTSEGRYLRKDPPLYDRYRVSSGVVIGKSIDNNSYDPLRQVSDIMANPTEPMTENKKGTWIGGGRRRSKKSKAKSKKNKKSMRTKKIKTKKSKRRSTHRKTHNCV